MNKPPRIWFLRLAILCTAAAAAFICLETFTRLFIKPPPSVIIENLTTEDESHFPLYYGLYVQTPTGLRLKSNTRVRVKNAFGAPDVEITTNSLGFRHPEIAEKGPDDFRILVLGDSITMADYLPDGQTYPARMAAQLKREQSIVAGRTFEVINAGVGSIGIQAEYAILIEKGLAVKPDIVVLGLYLNDAYRSPFIQVTRLPAVLRVSYFLRMLFDRVDKLRAMYRSYEWKTAHNKLVERELYFEAHPRNEDGSIVFRDEFEKQIHFTFNDWGYAWSEGYWAKVLPIIDLMKQTAADENFKLAVVLFPVAAQLEYAGRNNEPQKRFIHEMSKRNIAHLNLLPLLRTAYAGDGVPLFMDHCHYTAHGNDVVGRCIVDFLKQKLLLK